MNPDPREHGVRASSPHLPPVRPTPDVRQHASSPDRAPHLLRLHIQTPYADLGQQKSAATWSAPPTMTVAEAKDVIASGSAGYGLWERDGLRLVWRGRILRDDDALGAVLTDAEPTLHLVARPVATPVRHPKAKPAPTPTQSPQTQPTLSYPIHSITTRPRSVNATALADCAHYLLFAAREHLCTLIGAPVIAWDEMIPAPLVPRHTAKAAVMSVLRPYAETLRWANWETAFTDADDHAELQATWRALGRDGVTSEVRTLWQNATGRKYAPSGESADVELDHSTFTLHLPSLKDMAPSQLTHLLLYLRVTTLLPPLYEYLGAAQAAHSSQPSSSPASPPGAAPTPTAPPPGITVRTVYRGTITFRLPRISFTLVQHQFWSAARLATIVWMLSRSMNWNDNRLWLMGGCATAWWLMDGYNQWYTETSAERTRARRARRRVEAQARLADPEAARARREAVARGERVEEENPLDPGLMAAGDRARDGEADDAEDTTFGNATARQLAAALPLLHLWDDAAELRLPEDHLRVPGTPTPRPTLRGVPYTHPSFLVTQVLMPIYLWLLTLVPAFEARRARAIRARERTMRALVAEMNPRASQAEGEEETTRPLVLPDGISKAARRYYARVAERPEGIDWDEEREAQRAMAIPDEEAEAGAGIALL